MRLFDDPNALEKASFALETHVSIFSQMLEIYNDQSKPNDLIAKRFNLLLSRQPYVKSMFENWLEHEDNQDRTDWTVSMRFMRYLISYSEKFIHDVYINKIEGREKSSAMDDNKNSI